MPGIQLRRHPRADAQLLGPRARQSRRGEKCADDRQPTRGGAAGLGEDARAGGARHPAGGASAARASSSCRRCANSGSRGAMPTSSHAPRGTRRTCSPRARRPPRCGSPTRRPSSPSGRHRRPARSLHASQPGRAFSSVARSGDDDARAARHLRRRNAFAVHDPLPAAAQFGDEGAANHTRFAGRRPTPGVEMFVYGRSAYGGAPAPQQLSGTTNARGLGGGRPPARTRPARVVVAQQTPDAIDAGVFHNDVIAVGSGATLSVSRSSRIVDQAAVLDRARPNRRAGLHADRRRVGRALRRRRGDRPICSTVR